MNFSSLQHCLTRLVALLLIAGSSACFTVRGQADKLYEAGECNEALPLYEQAFEEGLENSEAFHHAARCALQLGEFSTAERFYSQALRHGGGLEVAAELADLYVKTSNYTSAVRVFQYLLYHVEDKRTVYSNLGTALMYAGQPFDAESYLLVAQQMDPSAPSTYLNLGVLYDRHLKQPWLAINFYDCFASMAGRVENAPLVRQRSDELKERWHRLYESDALRCGEVYRPASAPPVAQLKEEMAEFSSEEPFAIVDDPPADAEGDAPPVMIEPMISKDEKLGEPPSPEVAKQNDGDRLALGKKAYDEENWAQVVAHLSEVAFSKLGVAHYEMLGMSYLRQNNWSRAKHWLELAVEGEPKPATVEALAAAHTAAGADWRVAAICREYGNTPGYEKMRDHYCTRKPDEKGSGDAR